MKCNTIHSRVLRQLYHDWQAWCRGGQLPSRDDFDPISLWYALGHVSLLDVSMEGGAKHFRFRVNGQFHVDHQRVDLTGRWLDEYPAPETREMLRAGCMEVAESGQPAHYNRELFLDDRPWRYESVILPLGRDGRTVDMLLIGAQFAS